MKLINFKNFLVLIGLCFFFITIFISCNQNTEEKISVFSQIEMNDDGPKKTEEKKNEKKEDKKTEKKEDKKPVKKEEKKTEKKKEEKKTEKKKTEKKKEKKGEKKKEKKTEKKNQIKKKESKPKRLNKVEAKILAKDYVNFAKLPYCSELNICSACKDIKGKGYELVLNEKSNIYGENIVLIINRNKSKKETVISFGGIKSSNMEFIQNIYIRGFSDDAQSVIKSPVERVFWEAYTSLKAKLVKQIAAILVESESERVIFVGHSFGGSLAILAAYDLKNSNVVSKLNKPKIITFAALKIGSVKFLRLVHSILPWGVYRLRSIYDFYSFIPRCVYIPAYNIFHCYTSYYNLLSVWPVFASYLYTYSPVVRAKLGYLAPAILKSPNLSMTINKNKQDLKNRPSPKNANKNNVNNVLKTIEKHHQNQASERFKNGMRNIRPILNSYQNNKNSLKNWSLNNKFVNKFQRNGLLGSSKLNKGLNIRNNAFGKSKTRNNFKKQKFSRRRSFLETSMKIKKMKQHLFKRCEYRGIYLACRYDINVHTNFFGTNIENC